MVASNRNPKTGGRIPPQGRTPRAPGVGKSAKRHDLERPATPGLSNSSLQQGDVQELEQGQAIAPRAGAKRVQAPSSGGTKSRQGVGPSPLDAQFGVPGAVEFASQRLGGTLGGRVSGPPPAFDISGWLPLLQQLVSNPTSGGSLTQAYIDVLTNLNRRPSNNGVAAIDQTALDDAIEQGILNG
jgi:hypothetical protein